jgi:hypothetical protein
MSRTRTPRRPGRALLPGVATLAMLAAGTAIPGVPALAGAPVGADPVVRLAPDPGSAVRAAEVPVAAGEQALRTTSYSLVAATWQGEAPRVSVRAGDAGRWHRLPPLTDGPEPGSAEGGAVQGTGLLWTGPATGIDVRVAGRGARDVELVLIDPGEQAGDTRTAAPTPLARRGADDPSDRAPRPTIRSRKAWGADPDWRNGKPAYNDRLRQIHLHHTATGNDYRRTDVPGIIRGMYRYHTKTLGWFDIGYNFLVDRFGRAWVGRSGGAGRPVRGAHTLGFNHISVGVAVIGNFEDRTPRQAVSRTLTRLAAWKLDKRGRNATGKVWVTSQGSDKYAEGEKVRLPAFDGHRDTNDTACPGDALYALLPALRRSTQRRIDRFS